MDKKNDDSKNNNSPLPKKERPKAHKSEEPDRDETIQLSNLVTSNSSARMKSEPNLTVRSNKSATQKSSNLLNVDSTTLYSSSERGFDSQNKSFNQRSSLVTTSFDHLTSRFSDIKSKKKPANQTENEYTFVFNNDSSHSGPFSNNLPVKLASSNDKQDNQSRDQDEILFKGYVPIAFKYLRQCDQPRLFCLNLITSPWFERISMCIILINCITLGMYQPCEDNPCVSKKCIILKYVDHLIYVFFLVEMIIKIIAMGFRGENTYMAETWNRLDFFIVLAGTLEYAIATENLSLTSIRTVRVLRPLRAINRVPSMRILVMLLLDTLPMLGNVFLLCFFVFFIFGIIGVQLWKGVLRNRCYFDYNATTMADLLDQSFQSTYYTPTFTDSFICSEADAGGMTTCSDIPPYMNNSRVCNGTIDLLRSNYTSLLVDLFSNQTVTECINWNAYYTKCRPSDKNPFKGSISFDNIGFAWVAIFQIISLESWVTIMYFIQDAHSFWDWIYFVFLIVIGSFFMINLCLVVIATQFSETKRRETERMIAERKRFSPTSSTILSDFEQNEPGSCWSELLKFIAHIYKKAKRRISNYYANYKAKSLRKATTGNALMLNIEVNRKGHLGNNILKSSLKSQCFNYHLSNHQLYPPIDSLETAQDSHTFPINPNNDRYIGTDATLSFNEQPFDNIDTQEAASVNQDYNQIIEDCSLCRQYISSHEVAAKQILFSSADSYDSIEVETIKEDPKTFKKLNKTKFKHIIDSKEEPIKSTILTKIICCCCHKWFNQSWLYKFFLKARKKLLVLVESTIFQRAILVSILINTLSMGVEHHEQPALLTSIVELSNIVFSSIFFVEMLLKLLALGFFNYIKDEYNLFDGAIVCISVYEVFSTKSVDLNGIRAETNGQSISVLRTFRLLRILKLIRFMPALRRQLVIMLKTMDNVATFFSLLILFIFIFSILGMNLFGCKFCQKEQDESRRCERKNFDSLLWATITVFQVLTQEDWNEVLYSGMEKTSSWAALYFIALMTFGNYVLFNLLVAILVEGFSTEDELKKPLTDRIMEDAINAIKEEARSRDASYLGENRNDLTMQEVNYNPNDSSENFNEASNHRMNYLTSTANDHFCPAIVITHTCASPVLCRSNSSVVKKNRHMAIHRTRNLSLDSASQRINLQSLSKLITRSTNTKIHAYAESHLHSSNASFNSAFINRKNSTRSERQTKNNSLFKSKQRSLSESRHLQADSSMNSIKPPSIIISKPEAPPLDFKEINEFKTYVLPNSKNGNLNVEVITDEGVNKLKKAKPKLKFRCFKDLETYRHDASLFIFSKDNRFRVFCVKMTSQKWFDYIILLFIAFNCITLAMERPNIPPQSFERELLTISNYVFTALFSVEMLFKVISNGLYMDENAYLKSGWNIMDASLVLVSSIDIILSFTANSSPKIFGILRVFRLLRTLRPLRVISRAPGLKLVVQTLLSSLRPIGNIVLICCTFFIIFGILGVQLFKGKFYYCVGENIENVVTKEDCLANKRNQWLNTQYNFDNLGKALMALFVLSSKDGWVQIMYTGIDAVGIDMQPKENHNEWMLVYFISFLLLVGFFVLNMFVGVVIENFHKCRAEQEREEKAMRAAKRAIKIEEKRNTYREIPYFATYSRPRFILHSICNSKYFDLIIAAVIGLNVVSMSLEFYLMPEILDEILDILNYIFTFVFLLEAIMRVIALGLTRYIKDRWNQLDLLIVILSIVGIFFDKLKSKGTIPVNPTIIRVMRVLRIARVLKLLKMAKGIRSLLDTVIQALPQVGNLGLLFFLLFFIFATLGVELFGRLNCEGHKSACEGLSKHAHFHNFGMAFLTLFRIATGDNWNGIMKDTLKNNILCSEEPNPDGSFNNSMCLASMIAPLYFVVFVLMAQFVLVNVVVAVLMKHLDESREMIQDDVDIDEEIEIQMAKERRLKELNERQAQVDVYNNKCSNIGFRKHASVPSNFNYKMRTASLSSNIYTERSSIDKSRHSINLPTTTQKNTEIATTKNHFQQKNELVTKISEPDLTCSFDKPSSLNSLLLKPGNDNFSNNSFVTNSTFENRIDFGLNDSFRRRERQINQIKQIQNMINNSTSSYNSHFSPKPSVRIKIIDETDTEN